MAAVQLGQHYAATAANVAAATKVAAAAYVLLACATCLLADPIAGRAGQCIQGLFRRC